MKNSLSVAMVIHNEELHLEDSLNSIKNISDDIVIVHDGVCKDKSKEIAQKYNVNFVERDFIGIAEGHRIFSFKMTKNDWILVLDADEVVSNELSNSIPDLIKSSDVDAYEFVWPSYDGKRVVSNKWPFKKALFRKDKIKYIDFPQADIKTKGILQRTSLVLHHYPSYNNFTIVSFKNKWLKWVDIQAKATLRNFEEFEKIGYDEVEVNFSKFFLFKRNFPELFMFFGLLDFLRSVISGLKSGGSLHSLKSSFMWGLYNSFVYYKVMKLKWNR